MDIAVLYNATFPHKDNLQRENVHYVLKHNDAETR